MTHAQLRLAAQDLAGDESPRSSARRARMRIFSWSGMALALVLGVAVGSAKALDAGARLPEIGLIDLAGRRVDIASLKGKVVLVDFWASWCAPCKQEMPVLERLYQKYKDRGLVIVGVSVDQESTNVGAFLKQLKVSFPIVHDKAHDVANRFRPPRMPSSYIVDRNGVVRHVHGGFRAGDDSAIEGELTALLAQ